MTGHMAHMAWPVVRERLAAGAVVLVAVGAEEGHGSHLPLGTDTMIAVAVCEAITARVDAIITPPVPFGYKSQVRTGGGHHWPGNIGLGGELLVSVVRRVLTDLIAKGVTKIAIVNGHFENTWFIKESCNLALDDAEQRGVSGVVILSTDWWSLVTPEIVEACAPAKIEPEYEHAGIVETSLMMHIAPELVRLDEFPHHEYVRFPEYDLFPAPRSWYTESGALASAAGSSAAIGASILDLAARKLSEALITEFGVGPAS